MLHRRSVVLGRPGACSLGQGRAGPANTKASQCRKRTSLPSSRRARGCRRATPWGLSPRSSTATGAAFSRYGQSGSDNNDRSTATRCSRSARSPKCSPRCCLPTWCCGARWRRTIPRRNFCPPASKMPDLRRRADHACWISRPTPRACRGCRPISRRKTRAIPTSITPPSGFTIISSNHKLGLQAGQALRIRQSRLRPARPCARAARRQELRGACCLADLRAARHGRHPHYAFGFDAGSAWRGATTPGSCAGPELGFSGACRRRRAAFDGERPVQISGDVPGSRRRAARRRAEDWRWPNAVRRANRARCGVGLVRRLAVRRRNGLEGWRHRRLRHVHRLFDKDAAQLHPAVQCGQLCRQYRARHASGQRGLSARPSFAARCRSIRPCSRPMPAATILSPTFVLTVRPDGGRLFIQATAQPEFEVFAESETEFLLSRGRCAGQLRSRPKAAWRRR